MACHPLVAVCDNTGGEPLAWMLRRGSAGNNTAADHIGLADAAIAALPPGFRRKLMVTCDGAGASHALVAHLDKLADRRGFELTYSVGWVLGERERRPCGWCRSRPGISPSTAAARSASAAPTGLRGLLLRAPGLLGRGSARHRADRTAAGGPGREPAGRLARDDADLRAPRAAASRRAADLVRGRRRLAVLPNPGTNGGQSALSASYQPR